MMRGYLRRWWLLSVLAVVGIAAASVVLFSGQRPAQDQGAAGPPARRQYNFPALSIDVPPVENPVLVSASAVGYYGDRGEKTVTEDSPPGAGFLADTSRAWEAAAEPASEAGIRVVHPRIGMVLSARGGALATMLKPFRLGVGGVVGSGRQQISWIALADLTAVIAHLALADEMSGPVNAVAPHPVTNREFTATLGRVLGRPTLMPLPGFMVRLLFGEMGQALLLDGARVLPSRLEASGFRFRYPRLEEALRAELSAG